MLVTADPVTLEPWTGVAGATTGQIVTITVRDSNGIRLSDASGPIQVTMKDADTRIVAVWDAILQRYVTKGPAYPDPAIVAVSADRGQAKVVVRANTSGMKLYDAQYSQTGYPTISAQANGMFLPTGAENLVVTASSERIRRDGSVTLTARVVDQNGQTVSSASGTVTFVALPGSPISAPLSATVQIQDGVAMATFVSDRRVFNQELTANFYAESTVRRASTDSVLAGNISVVVDDLAPSLSSVTFRAGPLAPAAGTLNPEDEIILTFSEPINASDLVPGLTRGQTLNLSGASVISNGSTLQFAGVGGLGQITLTGAAGSTFADFGIDSIALNAAGTTLTLRAGARHGGADPVLTIPPATTADLTTSVLVKDAVGLDAGPLSGVTVTGAP
jgi:hypothetical protein